MGFKAKARKHRKDAGEDEKKQKASTKVGELPCGVKGCDNFADKRLGGRSLSVAAAWRAQKSSYPLGQNAFEVFSFQHIYTKN